MSTNTEDRKYMEIAVDEMKKSKSEHESKTDPLVGAVLVSAEGVELGRACRGGLREGNHAEYTLIERLLGNISLAGSTLYVTLEPCTSRRPPKKPCAEWVTSARIGRVFIGMLDPNPEIQGRGLTHLMSNKVKVELFDSDLFQIIQSENEDFIKQYNQKNESSVSCSFEEFKGPSEQEKNPVESTTVYDLSLEMIKEYLVRRNKSFDVPSEELWNYFQKNGFIRCNTTENILTVAGILLFGKTPEDFLVQSKIKAEAHYGDKVVYEDLIGPLLGLPSKVEDFLKKYMRSYTEIREFERETIYEYPLNAVREAVVNAIVHRDYTAGARVLIQLFDDKLIIKSPGLPLLPISLEKIRTYNAQPFSRNPRIAETFNYLNLMEERGSGFVRMRDELKKHGLKPPKFDFEDGYFVVTFFAPQKLNETIHQVLLAELDKRQKKIIDFVTKNESIRSIDCEKKLKINRSTATRLLNQLVANGILNRIGKGPSTQYILGNKSKFLEGLN